VGCHVSDASLPPILGGRYRPIRLLGKGGMGAVYEAEHTHTGQRVALKVLTRQPGASVERFKREARAASRIKSDHIVRVTDADTAPELDGAPFLVMELLEGKDLGDATGDRSAPPADVINWLRQVARGLTKAHDAGIVHRDLKPENLFLTQRDDGSPLVKILDFGIAKTDGVATALTASDAFLGTPSYMAPEQTDSRGPPITLRADLYALGLIAFTLLTGHMYWRSGSLPQLLAQILAEPMPPASERGSPFGPAFDEWFQRACSRKPEERFASATEQIEALAVVLGQTPINARISDPAAFADTLSSGNRGDGQPSASLNASIADVTTTRRKLARRRLFGGGVAIALLAVFGGAATVLRRPAEPAAPGHSQLSAAGPSSPPQPLPVAAPAETVSSTAPTPSSSGSAAPGARLAPLASASAETVSSTRRAAPSPATTHHPAPATSAKPRDPTEGAF
jgi:serine/threonine protein kinase